jgi:hypothetical protein
MQAPAKEAQPLQQELSTPSQATDSQEPAARTQIRSPVKKPASKMVGAASRHALDDEGPLGGAPASSKRAAVLREPLSEIPAPAATPATATPPQTHKAWGEEEFQPENVAPPSPGPSKEGSPSKRGHRLSLAVNLNTPEASSR